MLEKIYHILFMLCVYNNVSWGQFSFPELEFHAISPKGFRVELPDQPGIELFGFHGKLNDALDVSKEGDISGDVTSVTNGKWVFEDPNLELSIGDKIHYWAYVQHNRAGYAVRNKQWEVTNYRSGGSCTQSVTVATGTGSTICGGSLIFEDNFNGNAIDRNKWTVQQYIPSIIEDDNFEFVSYQDRSQNIFIRNSVLYLKPIPAEGRSDIIGTLDLTQGCTRTKQTACFYKQVGAYILPPVVSAKIVSKMAFRYGKIEIKARLPIGDWIYPQIELIPKDKLPSYPKILIAYTRGNRNLTLQNGEDLGNTLLFGGPVSSPTEPQRSRNLRSYRMKTPLGTDMRTYTLQWLSGRMDFRVESEEYGSIFSDEYSGLNAEYQIALGVGVGGNYDFPDDIRSGNYLKPWRNSYPRIMKDFYDQKSFWENSWTGDEVALKVDSVKVWAL